MKRADADTSALVGLEIENVLSRYGYNSNLQAPANQDVYSAQPPREAVYLAASLHTYHTQRYNDSIELIARRHPGASLLSPRGRWEDGRDWLRTYRDILAPVGILYILGDAQGFVGRGVWTETVYICDAARPGNLQVFGLLGADLTIIERVLLSVVNGGADWTRYAEISEDTAQTAPPVLAPPRRKRGCRDAPASRAADAKPAVRPARSRRGAPK